MKISWLFTLERFFSILILFSFCCNATWVSAQAEFKLLKEVNPWQENPNPDRTAPSTYAYLSYTPTTTSNGLVFYVAKGEEYLALWKTDGTTSTKVKEFSGTTYNAISQLCGVASITRVFFFFGAGTGSVAQLWTSDGTEAGTFMLRDFSGFLCREFNILGSNLLFKGSTQAAGSELWKSDGTVAGTVMVKDIYPGTTDGLLHPLTSPLVVNSTLYFPANDGNGGSQLWKTDGTANGTIKIAAPASTTITVPSNFVNANGTLFFSSTSGSLFKTDGTTNGTIKIASSRTPETGAITAVGGGVFYFYVSGYIYELWHVAAGESTAVKLAQFDTEGLPIPGNMVAFNGNLYFTAWNEETGYEVWKSDGTEEGTKIFKDLNPGPKNGIALTKLHPAPYPFYYYLYRPQFTVVGNYLYFVSDQDNFYLTRTDGTPDGTTVFKDFGIDPEFTVLSNEGGKLYFVVNDYAMGTALWKSDGTLTGTQLVKDLQKTNARSLIDQSITFNGVHYFGINDGVHGSELWRTDGTAAGTFLLKDINPGYLHSEPYQFTLHEGALYFVAYNKTTGSQVWQTDGTPEGTVRVTDIEYSEYGLSLLGFTNNKMLFRVEGSSNAYQMWAGEGIETDPVPLTPSGQVEQGPVKLGNNMLFTFGTPEHGLELWVTDGTAGGTHIVKDINSGVEGSYPKGFHEKDGVVYFFAYGGPTVGNELYRSDGTGEGTYLVKDIYPGNFSSYYSGLYLTTVNDALYFTAYDPEHAFSVYKSDGTEAGTEYLHDPQPGNSYTGGPLHYFNVNGKVLYWFVDGSHGYRAKSLLVINESNQHEVIFTSSSAMGEYAFLVYNDHYYFTNEDAGTGVELWKTDGTAQGTSIVLDINEGTGSSNPSMLTIINDRLYFLVTVNGEEELWRTDGECTRKVAISPGEIRKLFLLNETAVIAHVNDPEYAMELFYYNPAEEASGCDDDDVVLGTDPELKNRTTVYPNPTSGALRISNPSIVKNATVTDVMGKSYVFPCDENSSIDISSLPKGVYIVRPGNAKRASPIRIIKE